MIRGILFISMATIAMTTTTAVAQQQGQQPATQAQQRAQGFHPPEGDMLLKRQSPLRQTSLEERTAQPKRWYRMKATVDNELMQAYANRLAAHHPRLASERAGFLKSSQSNEASMRTDAAALKKLCPPPPLRDTCTANVDRDYTIPAIGTMKDLELVYRIRGLGTSMSIYEGPVKLYAGTTIAEKLQAVTAEAQQKAPDAHFLAVTLTPDLSTSLERNMNPRAYPAVEVLAADEGQSDTTATAPDDTQARTPIPGSEGVSRNTGANPSAFHSVNANVRKPPY